MHYLLPTHLARGGRGTGRLFKRLLGRMRLADTARRPSFSQYNSTWANIGHEADRTATYELSQVVLASSHKR